MNRSDLDVTDSAFHALIGDIDGRLRRVFCARFGIDIGRDVTNDVLAYAWEHRSRLVGLDNPLGYLYRVGISAHRRYRRWGSVVTLPTESAHHDPSPPGGSLQDALARLRPQQRTCVVLVHVCGWSYADVADITGSTAGSVRNHVHRGLTQLRHDLKEST